MPDDPRILDYQKRINEANAAMNFAEVMRIANVAVEFLNQNALRAQREAALRRTPPPPPQRLPPAPVPPVRPLLVIPPMAAVPRDNPRGSLYVEFKAPNGNRIIVSEETSAATLGRLVERIFASFGMEALETLSRLMVSRGPFISSNPHRDYLNRKTGEPYTNRGIPGTPFYVLTATDNQQKVRDTNEALRLIGLPFGSFTVELR